VCWKGEVGVESLRLLRMLVLLGFSMEKFCTVFYLPSLTTQARLQARLPPIYNVRKITASSVVWHMCVPSEVPLSIVFLSKLFSFQHQEQMSIICIGIQ